MIRSRTEISIDGRIVSAASPLIVSASRATDIPAFHGEWLLGRLNEGWCARINPFNGRTSFVSFGNTRFFVFWTKDPLTIDPVLDYLADRETAFLIHFTVNDYEREGLEPHLRPLEERIGRFRELACRFGRERLVWRFDPIILGGGLTSNELVSRFSRIGERLSSFTSRIVVSFVDITAYRRVSASLRDTPFREAAALERAELAAAIGVSAAKWGIKVQSCAENDNYRAMGITAEGCISRELLQSVQPGDPVLNDYLDGLRALGKAKDGGQRPLCRCLPSQDIGRYGTCGFACRYCYARPAVTRPGSSGAVYPDSSGGFY